MTHLAGRSQDLHLGSLQLGPLFWPPSQRL